jgi:hypothetical protein
VLRVRARRRCSGAGSRWPIPEPVQLARTAEEAEGRTAAADGGSLAAMRQAVLPGTPRTRGPMRLHLVPKTT